MNLPPTDSPRDIWSDWLLHTRHAGDLAYHRHVRSSIERFADRLLDLARLAPGMTLADIGAGDGLIAFRAIDRVGPSLRALLTDISAPMLRHAQALASERGVQHQCAFFSAAATQLAGIADATADVVATRAVLAYVPDKTAALREFRRVLKPAGRLSIAEPIFRDDAVEAFSLRTMIDSQPPEALDRFLPLLHRWKAAQFPDTADRIAQSPLANFSERDLIRFVQAAGFAEIHLELHIDILPSIITTWDVFIGSSPHPWAPPLTVILKDQFSPDERRLFEQVLRPIVETAQSVSTERIAYLTAKPIPA